MDPILEQFVPEHPLFTFKRAQSIKDQLVCSEFKGEFHNDACKLKGMGHVTTVNTCSLRGIPSFQMVKLFDPNTLPIARCLMGSTYCIVSVAAFITAKLSNNFEVVHTDTSGVCRFLTQTCHLVATHN